MIVSRQVRRQQERQMRKGRPTPAASPYARVDPRPKRAPADPDAEKIVECALIDRDGETHHGFKSHTDLRAHLCRKDPYSADPSDQYGFWTSAGRFVSRAGAKVIGVASGQLTPEWLTVQRELLSSDIW